LTSARKLAGMSAFIGLLCSMLGERVALGFSDATVIPGLLDLRHTWNRGVSFSLLWQSGDSGRHALSLALLALIIFVGTLAWRATDRLTAAGYGLIVGGALANLWDRSFYGAVFDYLALHLGAMPLFVFNAADAMISLGVVLLVADTALPRRQ
jgi:signal peptidase II